MFNLGGEYVFLRIFKEKLYDVEGRAKQPSMNFTKA
jgi:hypothetical protein